MKPGSRRRFLKQTAAWSAAAVGSQILGAPGILLATAPNEKLNVAGIGVGGQGAGDLRQAAATENIVALADVDSVRAGETFRRHEKAARYSDFRQMLDKEAKNIDAVIIATPDHMHATCALWCMQLGKHVYVEKPLTRTPWEARLLTQAAAKYRVATQMGNQGYSHEATRVAAEILWSGEIGEVREVHSWTGAPSWPQGLEAWPAEEKAPDTIAWDLWLGCSEPRPYSSKIVPFNWRGYFDFGTGPLGDWGIHIFGPAHWGLQLGAPSSVEVIRQEGKSPVTFPTRSVLRYDFPARGNLPPVSIYWYDAIRGADPYTPPGLKPEELVTLPGSGPQISGGDGEGFPGGGAGGPGGFGRGSALAGRIVADGDRNGDRKVTREELIAVAESWFDKLDAAKTGKLNQEQFLARFGEVVPAPAGGGGGGGPGGRRGGFGAGMSAGRGLFAAVDADRDGAVSRGDFTGAFTRWFGEWDKEKSGALSEEQLRTGIDSVLPRPDFGGARGQGGNNRPGGPGGPGGGEGDGGPRPRPSGDNQVFVGAKGYLATRGRGEGVRLLPNTRWAEYRLPPRFLTRSPGHMRDWLRASKGGDPACSNFSVSGPYAEWVTLGAIAYRFDGKLEWDAGKFEFTNNQAANEFLKPRFRKGWELSL
jgi:predicted dehydrogenase